tara:strand:- start:536 stop:805 length:270 start_codon:yes stop_codon:yes gene_type:complete
MDKKKNIVFKYFDMYCYGELIGDEKDPGWVKPNVTYQAFGYSINNKYLFYNGSLMDNVENIFDVGRDDFRKYLIEWFQDRYNLPVSGVV